MLKEPADSTS